MLRNIERQNKWGSVEGQFKNVQFRSGSRKVILGKGERFETGSRRLSENSNFFQNRGIPKKLPHRLNTLRCHYREFHRAGRHIVDIPRIIFSGMTCLRATHRQAKSLGKRAFSDSFLELTLIRKVDQIIFDCPLNQPNRIHLNQIFGIKPVGPCRIPVRWGSVFLVLPQFIPPLPAFL